MIKVIIIELAWVRKRKGLAREYARVFYDLSKAREWADKRAKKRKHIKFRYILSGMEVSHI